MNIIVVDDKQTDIDEMLEKLRSIDPEGKHVGLLGGEREVRHVLENLRYPVQADKQAKTKLRFQCFGNFEVFSAGGIPLTFKRNKSKELLAYMIDRRGANCTIGELQAVLWENKQDTLSQKGQLRNLIHDLKVALQAIDAADVLIRKRGSIAVNISMVECDYYDFLKGIPYAVNLYRGEYMAQYSWAEITSAGLQSDRGMIHF